ncbi:hypothetical protein Dsin_024321 [Dipteronia sinensis]|uniref:LOB domain-containing protein n=1 Tax=Dipteronia sinensis TaxID=43782 RepID=A0AAD9ZUA5_9ROSI|nr:hypothetical protein Dsin_024321 [Dipteronia sinensis]
MSCNGCRILRKGCSENCMLRQSLRSIDTPQAQANATLFLAKFFGRAGLISFISAVPHSQRPSLFQSLLYEAVGRTINPVSGAVGLLWTGNWNLCQEAMETVLCGGALQPLPDCLDGASGVPEEELDDVSESIENCSRQREVVSGKSKSRPPSKKRKEEDGFGDDDNVVAARCEPSLGAVDLNLTAGLPYRVVKRRVSMSTEEEESETTSLVSGMENCSNGEGSERKLLRLFF